MLGAGRFIAVPGIYHFAVAADNISHRHCAHPTQRFVLGYRLTSRVGGIEDVREGHLVGLDVIKRDLAVVGSIEAQDDQALLLMLLI